MGGDVVAASCETHGWVIFHVLCIQTYVHSRTLSREERTRIKICMVQTTNSLDSLSVFLLSRVHLACDISSLYVF